MGDKTVWMLFLECVALQLVKWAEKVLPKGHRLRQHLLAATVAWSATRWSGWTASSTAPPASG